MACARPDCEYLTTLSRGLCVASNGAFQKLSIVKVSFLLLSFFGLLKGNTDATIVSVSKLQWVESYGIAQSVSTRE